MNPLPSWLNGPTALYRHFDKHKTLLYVGITGDPHQRLAQHKSRSWWWRDHIFEVSTTWYLTCDDARAAETAAIKNERPLFNKTGTKEERADREQRKVHYLREIGGLS